MIDKEYGGYRLSCDCCDTLAGSFDTFDEAVAYARQEGWALVISSGGNKLNYCPECKEATYHDRR